MRNQILLLFILFSSIVWSQNRVVIVDSLYKKPIPFVNVETNENEGVYSNEKGICEVDGKLSDTLKFTHIAFHDYVIKNRDLKDTIMMSQKEIVLNDVEVSNSRKIVKSIDFSKKTSNVGSWPVNSKSEIVTLIIPSKGNINSVLKDIKFNFLKRVLNDENWGSVTGVRINIYNAKEEKIGVKLFSSKVFIINPFSKDRIELDLKEDTIEILENGLFIGIELIGDIDRFGNIIKNNSSIRPALTGKIIGGYTTKTYLKQVFDDKLNLQPLNEIIYNTTGVKTSRNLSFYLTILK